jgi:ribosomal subunit interface protein
MDVRVTIRDLNQKDELRAYVEEKLDAALSRFDERIRKAAVRLEDVSGGDHSGADKLCRIDVTLKPHGQVIIEEVGDEILAAFEVAVDRLRAALGREVGKSKRGVGRG